MEYSNNKKIEEQYQCADTSLWENNEEKYNLPGNENFVREHAKDDSTEKNSSQAFGNEVTMLSRNDIGVFTRRLSGKTFAGESKVVISYQTYAMEEPDDSIDKERVYTTEKPHIELSVDMKNPNYYVMDIVFKSYNDPELKMLWGRLQKFKRNIAQEMEKTWIFYFNILEKAGVTQQTTDRDTLFIANVFNPTLFYLTREIPDMLTTDTKGDNGELYGGNIIRMLVPTELVTFEITTDVDTSEIKGEVLREEEERRFLNNKSSQFLWNE